jgi:hypothetical protein
MVAVDHRMIVGSGGVDQRMIVDQALITKSIIARSLIKGEGGSDTGSPLNSGFTAPNGFFPRPDFPKWILTDRVVDQW